MALEQKYLNVTRRAEGYMNILMYIPDNNVVISNVNSDDVLSYSNIDSLKDIKNYTSTTIATLEENLWLLNGAFVNPTLGRRYNGYISNSISDAEGNFTNNPIINVELSSTSYIEYFSLALNPAVKSGYPREIIVSLRDAEGTELKSITKKIEEETGLPNLIFDFKTENVRKLKIEFIGTMSPNRRIRLSSLMFGKLLTLTQDELIDSDYNDKCSFVPDSIPSKTFSFTVENYDKRYDIDNPENGYVNLDKRTHVMMKNGYNIFGYNEETNSFENPDKATQIEWDNEWKEFRLLDISTKKDTCTFKCGSILDMMTDTYNRDIFTNDRSVSHLVGQLLSFMNLDNDIVAFSSDDNGKNYGDYIIQTPLPQAPVREIIQLLAFSVGATLLIQDNGTIKFANLKISDSEKNKNYPSFTRHHSFTYNDFIEIPEAVQLENTDKISLPKYYTFESRASEEESNENNLPPGAKVIQTATINTTNTEISYSACVPLGARKSPKDTSSGTVQSATLWTHGGILVCNLPTADPLEVEIYGYALETTKSQERSVTSDTLIIDTQLIYEDPQDAIKNKYKDWYKKKFKYKIETRGEPLVHAGDYCAIQTPFSGTTRLINGYVLSNNLHFNGAWSGDMEVVSLDS